MEALFFEEEINRYFLDDLGENIIANVTHDWIKPKEILAKKGIFETIATKKVAYLDTYLLNFIPLRDFSGEVVGSLVCVSNIKDALSDMYNRGLIFIVISLLCMGIGLSVILVLLSITMRPLKNLVSFFHNIATGSGDLSKRMYLKTVACEDYMQCGKTDCPAYGKKVECWHSVGSFALEPKCPMISEGRLTTCEACKVYKKVVKDEFQMLGTYFNTFIDKLEELIDQIMVQTSANDEIGIKLVENMQSIETSIKEMNEAVMS